MSLTRPLVPADETHAYLVEQLNSALRRTGMFSTHDSALWMLVNHLLFMESEPEAWDEQVREWEERKAWSSTGVSGVFRELFPSGVTQYNTASLYAEFARRRGWLRPDHVVPADEYRALLSRVRRWTGTDRSWTDVTAEFGPCSVLFGGSNPRYGKTLGYVGEDPADPMVCFLLWNGSAPGAEASWPELEEPVLLAVRFGDGPFRSTFTFTPEGRRRRPAPDHVCG